MDTQQGEGRAGYCLPPVRPEALGEVFVSPLIPVTMTCLQAAGAMERGTRTQPRHTEHPLKYGSSKEVHKKEAFHRQEGRESSPRQCHLCLLFNIRQQATASGLFCFRIYFTCLHCSLASNQLQVGFCVEWRNRNFGLVPTWALYSQICICSIWKTAKVAHMFTEPVVHNTFQPYSRGSSDTVVLPMFFLLVSRLIKQKTSKPHSRI